MASEASLKVQLSRWEHGGSRPNETYRVLLCSLYRATPKELGFDRAPQTAKGMRDRISTLESLVENLTAMLAAQGCRRDDRLGPAQRVVRPCGGPGRSRRAAGTAGAAPRR
ncbi:hypothetical protein ACFQV4_16380 [Streptomyces thermocarboxydus]